MVCFLVYVEAIGQGFLLFFCLDPGFDVTVLTKFINDLKPELFWAKFLSISSENHIDVVGGVCYVCSNYFQVLWRLSVFNNIFGYFAENSSPAEYNFYFLAAENFSEI